MGKDSPPATGRRTLPPASLRAPGTLGTLQPPRSLRPQRHPGRDLTRSSSQPAAGPGPDGTGRGRDGGGAVTQPRAGGRASGRAGGGRSAAAEVRRPPRRAAPLRSGCSGSRAGSAGRDPADRTTSPSSLPAGPRFPEGTRSQKERSQLSQPGRKTMECGVPLTDRNQTNCTDSSLKASS